MSESRRRITTWAGVTIIGLFVVVTVALWGFDRWVEAPRTANIVEAVEQGRQNGEDLCAFAVATSDALIAMAGNPEHLTDLQAEKLHQMRHVARQCRATPEGDQP